MTIQEIQGYRLSAQQARILRRERGSVSVSRCRVTISGAMEKERLAGAVRRATERHWLLRSTFHWLHASGMGVQQVEPAGSVEWWERDVAGQTEEQRRGHIAELWASERTTSFDLEKGPVIRAGLLQTGIDQHELLLSAPIVCADANAMLRLMEEIVRDYSGNLKQDRAETVQYVQYSEWQHELGQDSEGKEHADAFWRQIQHNASEPGRPLPWACALINGHLSEMTSLEFDAETEAALRHLAGSLDATLDLLLLACWQILLWRLNEGNNVPLCSCRNGRRSEDSKELVGPIGRYLPVPGLSPKTSFRAIAEELKERFRVADQWEEYWTESLKDEQNGILFELHELDQPQNVGSVRFEVADIDCEMEPYSLKLRCVVSPCRIRTVLHYDAAVEEIPMQRMLQQLQQLVKCAARDPEITIEWLDILPSLEARELLTCSTGESASYPRERCLHQLLEAQVDRSPDDPALIMGTEQMSYAELDRKANQLAHFLRANGVAPDSPVGIAMERSFDMVVAVLGVMKAGGAYLPLELSYPPERLRYMLEDSNAKVVLTHSRSTKDLPSAAARWVCVDAAWERIAKHSYVRPETPMDPENLAYVIYTSGSTGKPKGVMVPHRSVVNYLAWSVTRYGGSGGVGSMVHTPLAFDLTVTSLYVPLLQGQPVELIEENSDGTAIEGISNAVSAGRASSLLKVTPAHVSLLSQVLEPGKAAGSTTLMVIGGEQLYEETLEWWRRHAPGTRLVNEYGPTETAVGCCVYEINVAGRQGPVPIGGPISNTRIYVLDQELRMVPFGAKGEIYIAGESLGRGYWRRPDLTAARFLPDPYAGERGNRMYRTGDLARWRGTGELEYLGRNDSQIKLHGYRIELGEIEAVLRQFPEVRDAAVVRKEAPSGALLIAYAVKKRKSLLDGDGLRNLLRQKLPAYMVPNRFVFLDAMPYTANGKLNRHALQDSEQTIAPRSEFVPPRTEVETLIAGVWAEVLGGEKIGVHDHFFDLGGHSMAAVRIVVRLDAALKIELAPQLLFELKTIAQLAERIQQELQKRSGLQDDPRPALAPVNRREQLPLSYAQQRLWFFDQLAPGSTVFNLVQAIRCKGKLNLEALEGSLNEIVRRHEILRTTFPTVRGEPHQQIHPWVPSRLPIVDISKNPQEAAQVAIDHAENTPFDLTRGPLIRAKLLRAGEGEHVIVLAVHHIIFDAWSTGIFLRELAALYEAFSQERTSPLQPLPVQYADFSAWERNVLQGRRLQAHLDFWKQQLAGEPAALDLSGGHRRLAVRSFHGAKHDIAIHPEFRNALMKLGRAEGATLFMILLSAFECLLHCFSLQTDFVIGTDVANRNSPETENLIGFFINQLPIRVDLSGDPGFAELLARSRVRMLDLYAHQELPFDRLVDALKLRRSTERAPLFDVKLVLENTPPARLQLHGLETEALGFDRVAAKLDLTLLLQECDSGLQGWFEYNRDLFEPKTIESMSQTFHRILELVVQRPQLRLKELVQQIRGSDLEGTKHQGGEPDAVEVRSN